MCAGFFEAMCNKQPEKDVDVSTMLRWNANGDALFYRERLVNASGRILWTLHKGNDDWWISTPDGDVDGHFISWESGRKRCEELARRAGWRIE